jgi:hypothetical protein
LDVIILDAAATGYSAAGSALADVGGGDQHVSELAYVASVIVVKSSVRLCG